MSSAGAFRILIGELAVVGVDPGQACRDAGVDPAALDDPARPLGLRALGRILARAEDAARDPHLGLHVARAARGRGVLSYVFRAQPTVERALDEMARIATTLWEREDALRVARRGPDVTIAFRLPDALPRHALEFVVARMALGLRANGALVREVTFRHAPVEPAAEYERVLGITVRFRRPETALRVDAASLARPIPTASPEVAAALAVGLGRSAGDGERAATSPVAARVRRAIESALARGTPLDREALARELGMSGRTLARRLEAEGSAFKAVVEATRRRLAQRLVVDEQLPLAEVATRLGFADQSAFGKAFRRWFGASPSVVRARRGDA